MSFYYSGGIGLWRGFYLLKGTLAGNLSQNQIEHRSHLVIISTAVQRSIVLLLEMPVLRAPVRPFSRFKSAAIVVYPPLAPGRRLTGTSTAEQQKCQRKKKSEEKGKEAA